MKKGDDCDQCDGIFSQKNNSYVHKKSKHGGSKYDWNQCDSSYSFTQKGNLDTHKKSKHRGVMYNCLPCDYREICQFSQRQQTWKMVMAFSVKIIIHMSTINPNMRIEIWL